MVTVWFDQKFRAMEVCYMVSFQPACVIGGADPGGPPSGGAIPVQRLWFSGSDRTGLRVCAMQRSGLFQLPRSQALLEWQESDHSPIPAIRSGSPAWPQDPAPANLCCSSW